MCAGPISVGCTGRGEARGSRELCACRTVGGRDGARGAFRYRLGWPVFVPSTSDAFLFVNAFYKHNEALIP